MLIVVDGLRIMLKHHYWPLLIDFLLLLLKLQLVRGNLWTLLLHLLSLVVKPNNRLYRPYPPWDSLVMSLFAPHSISILVGQITWLMHNNFSNLEPYTRTACVLIANGDKIYISGIGDCHFSSLPMFFFFSSSHNLLSFSSLTTTILYCFSVMDVWYRPKLLQSWPGRA